MRVNVTGPACWPLLIGLVSLPALADVVTLEELSAPEATPVAGVANIAADGTVVGTAYPDGHVLRWLAGAEPEDLGGDTFTLENVMPLISRDGSTIVAASYFYGNNPNAAPQAAPGIWQGGTSWAMITGLTLGDSTPVGISADGTYLVGAAYPKHPPHQSPSPLLPWIWSGAAGQLTLDTPNGSFSAQAWAVSSDGSTAAGFGDGGSTDETRFGVRWVGTTAFFITDSNSAKVGQAIACNLTCSVIVGAGIDVNIGGGSPQAWRWSEIGGVEYLGTVAGVSDATYYAFDVSDDGARVVGSYSVIDPLLGPVNRGFIWSPADGIQDASAFLAANGIDYGAAFGELVVNSMTPDGRKLLINGLDENYTRRRAIIHIDPDSIFANGFDL